MKKKIMAVMAALAIMTVGTTAFAAGSPTAGSTTEDTTVAAGQVADTSVQAPTESAESMAKTTTVESTATVTVKAVAETTVSEAVVETKNILKDLKELGTIAGDAKIVAAATDANSTVTATVLSVVNLESTDTNATVTVKNSTIKADKTYVVLHYTATGWVTLPATVTADGVLTFKADNFSPFAVVELGIKTTTPSNAAATPATDEKSDAAASPKTGETVPVAVLTMLVCAAGIAVCSKREEQ